MTKRLRLLSFIVMTYMLAALCWWAILLYRKNTEVFQLESKLLQERYINDLGIPTVDVTTLSEFDDLRDKFDGQMLMIMGEAAVFGVVLILGIYFINRAFTKELAIAEKQKNFLLSITHELKSPLASINLILDTFIKRDLPSSKIKELSSDALQESTRLNDLFNKILLATRLGTAYQYVLQSTDISAMLGLEVDRLQKLYPATILTSTIAPGCIHEADGEALVSVFHNIMENALKYNTSDPKRINVVLQKEGLRTKITIEDNGIGIPVSERNNVFEQFYRVGSEETRTSKGTGLGLYIVKQIILAHKGKLSLGDSSLGGAAIEIIL